jgi:hypothetical protein
MLCCRTESTRLRCRCAGFWVLFASHVDEEQTGSRNDELLQIDSAEYVATFIVDRELCWEAQAAGKLPASIVVANHYSKMIYDMRSGGGGIATASLAPHVVARNSTTDHGASTASASKTARYPSKSIPLQSLKADKLISVDLSRPPLNQGIITSFQGLARYTSPAVHHRPG